jgi:hypothetical protein
MDARSGRMRVRVSAEIIDLQAERERRRPALSAPGAMPEKSRVAWLPVWFLRPAPVSLPARASDTRDG